MAYRVWQIAKFLNVQETTIRRLALTGELKGEKSTEDARWDFKKEDIAYFIIWHRNYLKKFYLYKPTSDLKNAYQILEKEVRRQLEYYV